MDTRFLRALALILALLVPVHGWAAVAFGTIGTGSGATTAPAPSYPASIAAGDLLVLCVGHKYPATPSSVATPSGWTAPSNNIGRGDDGLGTGVNDQGETAATMFYKVATGSESGSLTLTITSANASYAYILRYTNATGVWLAAAAQGGDASSGTSYSATMNVDPGIAGGDMVVACSGKTVGSTNTATSEALATTGITYGTAAERGENATSFGDNVGAVVSDHVVTSGTSSAAPVYSYTYGTNTAGGAVILRIREDASAATVLQPASGYLGSIIR